MDIGPTRDLDSSVMDLNTPAASGPHDKHRELVKAVREVNAAGMVGENHVLTISVDQDAKRPVVRIVEVRDSPSGPATPSEYVLELAEA